MRLSLLRRTGPSLILLALVGLAYLPLLLGDVLYQRDVGRHTYPEATFLAHSLAAGDSPLWNPLIGLGVSTLSNPLNQVFYPPNALQVALHSPGSTSFFLVAHLVLGALGMMALMRRLNDGVRFAGAFCELTAGLAWALSGYCTAEITAGLRTTAGAYLPWCALGLLHLARTMSDGKPWRTWIGATAAAAIPFALCFLAGEVFFPMFACAFAWVVVLGDALEQRQAQSRFGLAGWAWRTGLGLTLALVLAAGAAAVVLVPVKQAMQTTARHAPLARGEAEVGSLHPWRLAEMVAPGALGDPYFAYPAGAWVGEPGLGQRPLLYGVYLGSSVLVLALVGLGRRRALATALAVTAMLALLTALGRHTGLHAVVRTLIPPFGYMRGPEKYLVLLQACVALLAGLGVARLAAEQAPPWRRGAVIVVLLFGLALTSSLFPAVLAPQLRTSAWIGAAFAATATLLVWLVGRRTRGSSALLLGLVMVDLSLSVFALQNFAPAALLSAEPAAAAAVRRDARARGELAPPRIYRSENIDAAMARAEPPTSLVQVQRNLKGTLIDNHAGVFGIASLPGYDAALPEALTSLWLAGRGRGLDLLRLTGTAYAILPAPAPSGPGLRHLLAPAPGTELVFIEGALPRVYAARAAQVLPDAPARQAVFTPDVVAGRQVILASPPATPLPVEVADAADDPRRVCQLVAYAHARVEAKCAVPSASLAVFVEEFADGWSATVDGQSAPILRANLVMRAVSLSQGEHAIVLSFSPPGFRLALAVSVATVLLLGFMLVWGRRSRTPT